MNNAIWEKNGKTISGRWLYLGSDTFIIKLDTIDRITGLEKTITVKNDTPEFNGWKLKADVKI